MLLHSSSATERTARSSSKEKGRRVRFSPRWLTVFTSSAGLSAINPSRFADEEQHLYRFQIVVDRFRGECFGLTVSKLQNVLAGDFGQVPISKRTKVSEKLIRRLRVEI